MIYIADSKLFNAPTLAVQENPARRVQFISRCPDALDRKLAVRIKRRAFDEGAWVIQEDVGRRETTDDV